MRIILATIAFVILATPSWSGEVYFCSDKDAVGFKTSDNYKITTFRLTRFKVDIDFMEQSIKSNDINFSDNIEKQCVSWEHELYCISSAGTVFSINKQTGEYRKASTIVTDNPNDDIAIRYGTCEKF